MSEGTSVQPEYYIRQSVEIEVPDGILKGNYNTRIANLNGQALLLDVPQVGNLYLPVKSGQEVTLRYIIESWAYEAKVSVAARKDNLETPLMLINRPAQVDRRMLRKFVRVTANLDCSLVLISDLKEYGREKFSDSELKTVVLEDISGGGARLRVPADIDTKDKRYALLWFTLPIIHKSFFNMLTRVKAIQEEPGHKFLIIEFTGLSEAERDDIVKYCARRQMELSRDKVEPMEPK